MNLIEKKKELIELISGYLTNQISLETLQEFSWIMIDYFSKTQKSELPAYQDSEKEFWYTIWQIQHIGDEEHEKEGITRRVLLEALEYLNKTKAIPKAYVGLRP